MKLKKSIFTAASPNTQLGDVLLALKVLFTPWTWALETFNIQFEESLKKILNVGHVKLVDSGRSALYVLLKSLGLKEGDEVIAPSFTCVVVANSISWTGATPVYLDSNKSDLNPDYSQLEKAINFKTRAIVVQHTFGKLVDVDAIKQKLSLIGREDIFILEDFAHLIESNIQVRGDAGFLTFGIEKVISSVRGGAIITNSDEVYFKISPFINTLPNFPFIKTFISLLNPVFWWVAIPLHSVGVGRFTIGAAIRYVWRKMGFLGIMVEKVENMAIKPDWFPAKMSPALSRLGIKQLTKLVKYNEHRSKIASIYDKYLIEYSDHADTDSNRVYLRYPVLLKNAEERLAVWNIARKERVTLGNWFAIPLYGSTVNDTTYQRLCYIPALTPNTINHCKVVLNLPTSINISEKRAEELCKAIKNVIKD